ncbi:hypothetical protein GGE35_002326 [Rhizobium cellulosilyticum]|uniref:Uncharacterized protein n=1 Tax=Aliirhizobium cellulosilyticum TaxID=393664 RepID=A0A7W6S8Q9_9HYPH|nr:hypothetical protein [Rhizobium cellulosilyticum]MBB4348583.1 hypothetical protein [Rhizobium cellulosilyticum]MBB4411819.1 hypothetical protein [Rhizobium cellulosilyticum]MBB4446510.1 hypothetical protein [Rhizobium cellulosilyticum]
MAKPEHPYQAIGPAIFDIHFQLCDVGGTAVATRSRRDVFQMLKHHVAFVFAKLLELRLGHRFLQIHLQFGQQRVELPTDDLRLFMIRTVKAQ